MQHRLAKLMRVWQWLVGGGLVAAALAWITYRLYRRLRVAPYVDFAAFYAAGQAARSGADPYTAGCGMYIYPPMLAAWMAPLSLLPQTAAAWLWYACAVATTLGSLWLAWGALGERLALPAGAGWLGLGLALAFGLTQTRWEFEQGQCDWLLLACLCLCLAVLDRAPWAAGLALGFAINIKYLPVAVLAYLVARRRWRVVAWAVAGTAGWALAPALVYGWSRNAALLLRGVTGLGKLVGIRVEGQPHTVFDLAYDRSVSLPSALTRLAGLNGLGMGAALLAAAAAGAAVCALGWWLYRRHERPLWAGRGGDGERLPCNRGAVALEWSVMLALMLTFSPQAMSRHFFLALPLLLLAGSLALAGATPPCRRLAWAGLLIAGLGTLANDLFALAGLGRWWTFVGGESVTMLVLAFCTLAAGFDHLRSRERSGA